MLTPMPTWVEEEHAAFIYSEGFKDALRSIGRVGIVGTGGTYSSNRRFRTAAAAAFVYDEAASDFHSMHAKVPGAQTVPRAELWALYGILCAIDGTTSLTIYIDATYTIAGVEAILGRSGAQAVGAQAPRGFGDIPQSENLQFCVIPAAPPCLRLSQMSRRSN